MMEHDKKLEVNVDGRKYKQVFEMKKKPKTMTIKTPMAEDEWRDKFRNVSMKIGFTLHLTKSMLEFLSAISQSAGKERKLSVYEHQSRSDFSERLFNVLLRPAFYISNLFMSFS